MCDGAIYIRTAAKNIWPNIIPILCLFHFGKAFQTKLMNKDFIPKVKIVNGKIGNQLIPPNILQCFTPNSNLPENEKFNPNRVIRAGFFFNVFLSKFDRAS